MGTVLNLLRLWNHIGTLPPAPCCVICVEQRLSKCSRRKKERRKRERGEGREERREHLGGDKVVVIVGVPGDKDGKVFSAVKSILRAK